MEGGWRHRCHAEWEEGRWRRRCRAGRVRTVGDKAKQFSYICFGGDWTHLGKREEDVEEPAEPSPFQRSAQARRRINQHVLAAVLEAVLDIAGSYVGVGELEVLGDLGADVGQRAKVGNEGNGVFEVEGGEGGERLPCRGENVKYWKRGDQTQHAPLSYSEPASICGDVSFVQRPKTATSCLAPCSMSAPCIKEHQLLDFWRIMHLTTHHLSKSRALPLSVGLPERLGGRRQTVESGEVGFEIARVGSVIRKVRLGDLTSRSRERELTPLG